MGQLIRQLKSVIFRSFFDANGVFVRQRLALSEQC